MTFMIGMPGKVMTVSAGFTGTRITRGPSMPATVARATRLIVDDQPENLAVLGGLLQNHDEVLVASSGVGALAVATQQPTPNPILLDIMMPEMDGYAVLNALHGNPVTHDIPVLLLTGLLNRNLPNDCLAQAIHEARLVEAVCAGFRYHESGHAACRGVAQQWVPDGMQAVP